VSQRLEEPLKFLSSEFSKDHIERSLEKTFNTINPQAACEIYYSQLNSEEKKISLFTLFQTELLRIWEEDQEILNMFSTADFAYSVVLRKQGVSILVPMEKQMDISLDDFDQLYDEWKKLKENKFNIHHIKNMVFSFKKKISFPRNVSMEVERFISQLSSDSSTTTKNDSYQKISGK
jgi:hypothetical protein